MNESTNINYLETPVLFLVFNRFETMKEVFHSICLARPKRIYVASDGPRNGNVEEVNIVLQIRNWIIDNIDWDCQISTLFRENNLGCAKAVSSAIDWFFEHEERGIILEDDCLPNSSFFRYCEDMLNKYENDTRIMHIAGSNLLTGRGGKQDSSYYFSKYANVWGWATWRRAWKMYDLDIKTFQKYREMNFAKYYFSYFPAYLSRVKCYTSVLNVPNEERTLNTWDYQWCYTCASNSGLSIVPNVNLIKNIGFGSNATHTCVFNPFLAQDHSGMYFPLSHPDFIIVDQDKDLKYEKKIFGTWLSAFKIIIIDIIRKIFFRRKVTYLKYL